ncbi:TLD domain-containing protein mustard isoform X3 [Amblyomma americanum]
MPAFTRALAVLLYNKLRNKTQSVDCHGYVNPLELVLDTSKKDEAGGRAGRHAGGPLEPLLGPLAAAAATATHGGPSTDPRRRPTTSPGAGKGGGGGAAPSSPLPPAPQSAPPTTTTSAAASEITSGGTGRKQLSRTPTQPPPGALEYVVKASDTLAGIAARFECTPGELTTMNRLTSRLIFPGQMLYIPVKEQESQAADSADLPEHGRMEDDKASAGHHGTGVGPPLPSERPCSPRAPASPPDSPVGFVEHHRNGCSVEHLDSAEPENKENMDMFLKISSRHITDGQGVVMGTLLVTPNNVMFVPNVSDALVMEHGSECYEVTAPMDMVVAAALYNDITHMRLRDTVVLDPASGIKLEEPYRPADYQPPPKDQAGSDGKERESSSMQQCRAEVQAATSAQPCDKVSSEWSHSESALEDAMPDQNVVLVTSPPKTPAAEDLPVPTNEPGAEQKLLGSGTETENKAPTTVVSRDTVEPEFPKKALPEPAAAISKSEGDEQPPKEATKQGARLESSARELKENPEQVQPVHELLSAAPLEGRDTRQEPKDKSASEKVSTCVAPEVAGTMETKSDAGGIAPEQSAVVVVPTSEALEKIGKAVMAEVREPREAAGGEVGMGESNKLLSRGTRPEAELCSTTIAQVEPKHDRAGDNDKPARDSAAAVTNHQEKFPPPPPVDTVAAQKQVVSSEASAVKREERLHAEDYSFKPIEKGSESPPTVRRDQDSGSHREKSFTPPPQSSSGRSLPEPARWARMLSPTLKLDSTSSDAAVAPAVLEPKSTGSTENVTLRMREWASTEGGVASERSQESAHERVLKRLSNPMESISSYTHSISKMIASSPKSLADFVRGADEPAAATQPPPPPVMPPVPQAGEKRPSSRADNANVWLKNMVEEKPELFEAFEKLGFIFDDNELVPRLAQSSEATLLYLCLRMGRPLHKKVQCSVTASLKRRIRPQYWFGIPRNRADELYCFLEKWAPSVYGDVHRVDLASRGFEPLPEPGDEDEAELFSTTIHATGTSGTEEGRETPDTSGSGSSKGHHGSKRGHGGALRFFKLFDSTTVPPGGGAPAVSPGDWEVVSMSEARRESPLDLTDLPLPELLDSTEIFTEEHRRELCKHLPARAESYSWGLVYSTLKHGFSLKTLYREMLKVETPILLAVLDTEGAVFGVLTSCSLRMSDHFYGTGESFLFTFHPEFKLYKWTGDNVYFIKGNADSLAFGAGDGQFGLWLDGDLFHGRSRRCKTYGNDVLSSKEDFVVKALEAWGFV